MKDSVEQLNECYREGECQKHPEASESASTPCSDAASLIDWEANIINLQKDVRIGCSESKVAVAQYELAGRRVELQLLLTDDEGDFIM